MHGGLARLAPSRPCTRSLPARPLARLIALGSACESSCCELNRLVALKILAPTLAANALSRARFVREARAAAAVVPDNVVPIYAVDECAGLPYLVMQFVHGRTLSERIRLPGPLQLEEILRGIRKPAACIAQCYYEKIVLLNMCNISEAEAASYKMNGLEDKIVEAAALVDK